MSEIIHLLADGLIIPIALGAVYAFLFKVSRSERPRVYSLLVVTGMTTYLLAHLIAVVWQPDVARPFIEEGVKAGALYLPNPGFPSDHALFCTFLTLSVWFLTRQKKLSIAMGIMTLLVCVGRVLAMVHTPLDVIGGVIIACLGAVWLLQYPHTAHAKKPSRVHHNIVVQ